MSATLANFDLGGRLSRESAFDLAACDDLDGLMRLARARRSCRSGAAITYSRKVFIPLTQLCRDVCSYCTFAKAPRALANAYLTFDQVREIAGRGVAAGCREALFTLGDKPELRYRSARDELDRLGFASTIEYLHAAAEMVLREFGLFPHTNPGVMDAGELASLRSVSVSQGLMLESVSERLCARGGPHHGSPDKRPDRRLNTIRLAGELSIPFTSGILIGIGETRRERVEALLALRDLNDQHGHLQEVIVQNFLPKPGTRMHAHPAAATEEHLWSIAVARLVLDPETSVQAPPNLSSADLGRVMEAGIDDWGGVSPVTPDHVNPEAPWPHLERLAEVSRAHGLELVERLAIHPRYCLEHERWLDPALRTPLLHAIDTTGHARADPWSPGLAMAFPRAAPAASELHSPGLSNVISAELRPALRRAMNGATLTENEVFRLFTARGPDFDAVCRAADDLRQSVNGDAVSYVITRNINYTNVCIYRCAFCAFSKGKTHEALRGRPYDLPLEEIGERAAEAGRRGATEVCMQGGIHPAYTGETYLGVLGAVKKATPDIHVHAFSPLEVWQGASTLGVSLADFLVELKRSGLGSLPGTAAEILDDEVRATLCPDKIGTETWLEVMRTAHRVGLRSTATIMFGHMERAEHWARHLLRLRSLQAETGGFTEIVPLPFVHMEAPIYLKGRARRGPTAREVTAMHAVARLALHPHITNVQASWVKLGLDGLAAQLEVGVNDLGGTLMNETISRSAGAAHGQEVTPAVFEGLARQNGRKPYQRTTLYAPVRPHLPESGKVAYAVPA